VNFIGSGPWTLGYAAAGNHFFAGSMLPAPYVYFADYRNSHALPRGKIPRRKSKFSEYSTHESLNRVSDVGFDDLCGISTTKLLRQSCVDGSELKLSRTTLMFNDNVDFALRFIEGNI
jgi:hypothetical protein